ncbi:hypothetical protein [Marinomonas mediterranea]|uniref:hypothetical protein n=1 Tax=Marinomonas mediterranea TaxID=119864 RepID=UPI00234A1887|nr:hypothetical protein [Marinomonas mediterranea]WCN09010.1 hypothetical protein GV055_08780 [Marinomonas mediterranea]WCN13044.1 hypothetical protein GV054_08510 [Marinomonas mediterranea]
MNIEQAIALWDGKSADDIKAIYDAYNAENGFADSVITLSLTQGSEIGATWLLKAWLEEGNRLAHSQISKIYRSLNQLKHWEAKLHVLQSISFMPIADTDDTMVYNFLMHSLSDKNKFVRAWSYNGLYELSKQHSVYKNETQQFFEIALRDEAPSVKARIRNIMKAGF